MSEAVSLDGLEDFFEFVAEIVKGELWLGKVILPFRYGDDFMITIIIDNSINFNEKCSVFTDASGKIIRFEAVLTT